MEASAWCGFSPKQSAADVQPAEAWPEAEGLEEALWVVRLATRFWPEMGHAAWRTRLLISWPWPHSSVAFPVTHLFF